MHGFAHYGGRVPQMMDSGHGLFAVGAPIVFLLVAAIVVGLVVWALTRRSRPAAATAHLTPGASVSAPFAASTAIQDDEALMIARERLARGEIDVQQYTTIVEALRA